jgi:N6-L-threonylcarbamoyladenine synthase
VKILGIETSCDETSAAVVEDGVRVLSNVIFSQVPLHRKTGGVVPEVAAREHVVKIMPVIAEAIGNSAKALRSKKSWRGRQGGPEKNFSLEDIDVVAVTQGPGLLSSLVIGTTAASTLAAVLEKPLIGVNHIAGHIYANWLNPTGAIQGSKGWRDQNHVEFPCVVLTASGGHNELVFMRGHDRFELLGETLDDAAGEAFDKVARLLGMGYPGGPQIARAARKGNAKRYDFPKAYMGEENFDFSFSGLKTSMLNFIREEHRVNNVLSEEFIADCSASFQEAVCGVLSDKLLRASQKFHAKTVIISGGVSANQRLRSMIAEKIEGGYFHDPKGRKIALKHRPVFDFPADNSYCTDNAAMIAGAAYFHVQRLGGLSKFTARKGSPAIVLGDPHLRLYS